PPQLVLGFDRGAGHDSGVVNSVSSDEGERELRLMGAQLHRPPGARGKRERKHESRESGRVARRGDRARERAVRGSERKTHHCSSGNRRPCNPSPLALHCGDSTVDATEWHRNVSKRARQIELTCPRSSAPMVQESVSSAPSGSGVRKLYETLWRYAAE